MADTLTEPQRAWIAALRSGEYKQTTRVLTRLGEDGEPVGHCCLGVACDLAVKAGLDVEMDRRQEFLPDTERPVAIRTYDGGRSSLPASVMDWLGLRGPMGQNGLGSLASCNDAGETFERIADIIEQRPEGLFT